MKLSLPIALSIAALATFAAHAADYDPPIVVDDAPEYVPVEVGSGWYLRGDVGYIFSSSIDGVDYTAFDGVGDISASFNSASIDPEFAWGGGFGYRFTDYFRADATIEGFRAGFSGTTSNDFPCLDDPEDDTTCRSKNSSEVSVLSVMANGYVDLGTFVGFTPYAGAGVGMSYVSWHDLNDTTYCVDGTAACPSPPAPNAVGGSRHRGEDGWRFTYALMAGVAYDITRNFKLDLGYKYRNVDGGDMFGWDSSDEFGNGSHGNIETHEVKLGLRYELW